jgi:hypothetical protein
MGKSILLEGNRLKEPQGAWHDGKGFEICTAGLEFKSGRAPLVRAWDSRGFTPSPGPTKCAFRVGEVSSNPKKKKS